MSAPSQIAVLGCGYVGAEFARQARAAGHGVLGVVRSEASRDRLRAEGIPAEAFDLFAGDWSALPGRFDAVVYAASTGGGGPEAVDMAAQGAAAVAPGQLKRPLGPPQHLLGAPCGDLRQVGGQGARHRALPIRKGRRRPGLVAVHMGIDQRRQGQGKRSRHGPSEGMLRPLALSGKSQASAVLGRGGPQGADPTRLVLQHHGHQALAISRWQIGAGIQQAAGDPQGRQQDRKSTRLNSSHSSVSRMPSSA